MTFEIDLWPIPPPHTQTDTHKQREGGGEGGGREREREIERAVKRAVGKCAGVLGRMNTPVPRAI
jgi:hypothetical protein